LALGNDGKLYAWGYNIYGELGDGSNTDRLTPVQVSLPAGATATAVWPGSYHSLALGSDGKLYAWGQNHFGQLGDGSNTDRLVPVRVSLPAGVTATAVSAGGIHNLALGSDGKLYAWGDNVYGQLGDGSTTNRLTPGAVSLQAGVTATAVSAGTYHSLALGSEGKLYSWGYNANGQLGDGSTTNRLTPVLVITQTITFDPLADKTVGAAPFSVATSSSSGLAVSLQSLSPTVCSVSGNTVSVLGLGTCTLQASQPGNATEVAAQSVKQSFVVVKLLQSVTFGSLSGKTLGDIPFSLSATASSGLAVTFSSLSTGVCSVSASIVTMLAAGTCSLQASQSGDNTYQAAASVTQSFAVGKLPQSITFGGLSGKTLSDSPFSVSGTASSGLAMTFSSLSTSVCTVSANTVTLLSAGTCSVQASQPGDSTYQASTSVTQSFTVGAMSQSITFGSLSSKTLGTGKFSVTATASSGLAVTFSSLSTSVCTVSVNTVTLLSAGTCSVQASQPGDSTYQAATSVTQSFTVGAMSQSITFGSLSNKTLGHIPFIVSATASSGLTMTFSSLTTSVCSVSGSTVKLLTAGTCTLQASQPGDSTYAAATPVVVSFVVMTGGAAGADEGDVPLPPWASAALGLILLGGMATSRRRR
jgi:hypothetical protein